MNVFAAFVAVQVVVMVVWAYTELHNSLEWTINLLTLALSSAVVAALYGATLVAVCAAALVGVYAVFYWELSEDK